MHVQSCEEKTLFIDSFELTICSTYKRSAATDESFMKIVLHVADGMRSTTIISSIFIKAVNMYHA